MRMILSLVQALLFVVSSFAVSDSSFKLWVDRAALGVTSTDRICFDSITAEEAQITENEKNSCREWFEKNIRCTDKPAYNFFYGGKDFRVFIKEWNISVGEESTVGAVYRGGKTSYITLTHKNNGLVATVEATIYEENATCEWTVFLKNTAQENSPVISSFSAADCVVPVGNAKVYLSKGSEPAADDFELVKSNVNAIPMRFTANGGRSEAVLPYFNLSGRNNGAVFAVGWSGQWQASLSQSITGVKIKAKQEKLKGYLSPDEEIRSPLVSLTFYDGNNALKGFNGLRKWTLDCVYPEGTIGLTTSGLGNEFSSTTAETMIQSIKDSPEEFTDLIDAYWIDAGWYEIVNTDWHDSVGTWKADPARYPDGLAPIAEAAAERGIRLLAWYEPERCSKGTEVYNECIQHDGWIVEMSDERNMVNLANEDALAYITELIYGSLIENKVSVMRIDCIPQLSPYWEKGDEMFSDGRKGFVENHYITNLYRFLDTMQTRISGLMIDNCCSGGKRIDIEMSRRSIPLWRSDYNCADGEGNVKEDIVEATQSMTYGLSFWLPYSGGCAYVNGEYADRSNILSCSQQSGYKDVRRYMTDRYYPLSYGGTELDKYHAMQFDTNDGGEGASIIYKRKEVNDNTYILRLKGLTENKTYIVYNYDTPEVTAELTGAQLMNDGLTLSIKETPKAVIVVYKAK